MWKWTRCSDSKELEPLLSLVEPAANIYDREGIATRFPHVYRAYVGTLTAHNGAEKASALRSGPLRSGHGPPDAIVIACWLPRSHVLHVETFALSPAIRHRQLARTAWQSWRKHVAATDWTVTKDAPITIEVYLHNIEAWRKILEVTELDITANQPPQFLSAKTPIVLMGSCTLAKDVSWASRAYGEWQTFQRVWHSGHCVGQSRGHGQSSHLIAKL